MTETTSGSQRAAAALEPFVTQVCWLIAAAGGKEQLVQRCGGLVSVRTLDNWTAGNYPRTKVTGAVRELDAWARAEVAGYPAAAGVPGLVDSCGPYRAGVVVPPSPDGAPPDDDDGNPELPARPRRRWPLWALAGAALLVVIAVSAGTTLLVVRHADAADREADEQAVAQSLVDVPLPSTGDGTLHTERSGSIGAKTFGDPRSLTAGGEAIPPDTEIQVRCRYYAPSVPSVTPDGFWYLVETDRWNGLWTPANSFLNGDVPGGPYTHKTDVAVPICR
jgi:hypothetical protein